MQKELERVKRQLIVQKRKNQQLAEMVQGNPRFHSPKLSQLNTLTSESHDNTDADLGPESEELDEEPSAMQFSNAVSTGFLTLHYLAIM